MIEEGQLRLVRRCLLVEDELYDILFDGEFTLLNHCTKLKDSFYNV